MKPRMIGSPYKALKDNRDKLTKTQYETMKGQVRCGRADDAMRGLQRLLEIRTKRGKI